LNVETQIPLIDLASSAQSDEPFPSPDSTYIPQLNPEIDRLDEVEFICPEIVHDDRIDEEEIIPPECVPESFVSLETSLPCKSPFLAESNVPIQTTQKRTGTIDVDEGMRNAKRSRNEPVVEDILIQSGHGRCSPIDIDNANTFIPETDMGFSLVLKDKLRNLRRIQRLKTDFQVQKLLAVDESFLQNSKTNSNDSILKEIIAKNNLQISDNLGPHEDLFQLLSEALKMVKYHEVMNAEYIQNLILSWLHHIFLETSLTPLEISCKKKYFITLKIPLDSSRAQLTNNFEQLIMGVRKKSKDLNVLCLDAFSDMFRVRFRFYAIDDSGSLKKGTNNLVCNTFRSSWPVLNVISIGNSLYLFDSHLNERNPILSTQNVSEHSMHTEKTIDENEPALEDIPTQSGLSQCSAVDFESSNLYIPETDVDVSFVSKEKLRNLRRIQRLTKDFQVQKLLAVDESFLHNSNVDSKDSILKEIIAKNDLQVSENSGPHQNVFQLLSEALKILNYHQDLNGQNIQHLILSWFHHIFLETTLTPLEISCKKKYLITLKIPPDSSPADLTTSFKELMMRVMKKSKDLNFLCLEAFSDMFRIRFRFYAIEDSGTLKKRMINLVCNSFRSTWPVLNVISLDNSLYFFDSLLNGRNTIPSTQNVNDHSIHTSETVDENLPGNDYEKITLSDPAIFAKKKKLGFNFVQLPVLFFLRNDNPIRALQEDFQIEPLSELSRECISDSLPNVQNLRDQIISINEFTALKNSGPFSSIFEMLSELLAIIEYDEKVNSNVVQALIVTWCHYILTKQGKGLNNHERAMKGAYNEIIQKCIGSEACESEQEPTSIKNVLKLLGTSNKLTALVLTIFSDIFSIRFRYFSLRVRETDGESSLSNDVINGHHLNWQVLNVINLQDDFYIFSSKIDSEKQSNLSAIKPKTHFLKKWPNGAIRQAKIITIPGSQRQSKFRKSEKERQKFKDFFSNGLPNDAIVKERIAKYLERIGPSCQEFDICSVCSYRVRKFQQKPNFKQCFSEFKKALPLLSRSSQVNPDFVCDEKDFYVKDFFLDADGVFDKRLENGSVTFNVCSDCIKCLIPVDTKKKPSIPPASLANGNELGEIPDEFKDLKPSEEFLIRSVRPTTCVIKLHDMGGNPGHRALKGNCIAFQQDVTDMERKLPRSVDSLSDDIQVLFVGSNIPPNLRDIMKHLCTVRRPKVLAALEKMRTYGTNFTLSQENLRDLPDDDVPDSLFHSVQVIVDKIVAENDKALHEGYFNFGVDDPENKEPDSDHIEMCRSGVIDLNSKTVDDNVLKNSAVRNVVNEFNKTNMQDPQNVQKQPILVVPRLNEPVNEYGNEELWYDGFPTLFPERKGAPEQASSKRKVKFSLKQWAKHAMMIKDPRFREHHSFMFYVSNMLKRRDVCFNARLNLKYDNSSLDPKVFEEICKMPPDHFEKAANAFQTTGKIDDPNLRKIMKLLTVSGSKISSHVMSRLNMRHEIQSLFIPDKLPRIFLTINPNDFDHKLVCFYAGAIAEINISPSQYPKYWDRRLVATKDPVACALFFQTIITAVLECLLGHNGTSSQVGVLGKVKEYYGTVETQGRGTLHLHMLIWLDDFPSTSELDLLIKSPEFLLKFENYLDFIVKASIPEISPEVEENLPADFPSYPLPQNFDQLFPASVARAVKKYQQHKCTGTCHKYVSGRENCRFGFGDSGKKLVEKTVVKSDGSFEIARNSPFTNQFNPSILTCIKSNMDIKFISTVRDSRALSFYITYYITKNTSSTNNLISVIGRVVQKFRETLVDPNVNEKEKTDAEKAVSSLIRCLNKMNVLGDQSGPETACHLLDIPNHFTSAKFSKIFVGSFLNSMKLANRGNDDENYMEEDDEEEEDRGENFDFELNNVTKKICANNQKMNYLHRGDELKDVCLYRFVCNYSVARCRKYNSNPDGSNKSAVFPRNTIRFNPSHPLFDDHYITKKIVNTKGSLLKLPPSPTANPEKNAKMTLLLFAPFRQNSNESGGDWVKHLLRDQRSWEQALKFHKDNDLFDRDEEMVQNRENLDEIYGAMDQRVIDNEVRKNMQNEKDDANDKENDPHIDDPEVLLDDIPVVAEDDDLEDIINAFDLIDQRCDFNLDLKAKEQVNIDNAINQIVDVTAVPFSNAPNSPNGQNQNLPDFIDRRHHVSHVKAWKLAMKKQEKIAKQKLLNPEDPQNDNGNAHNQNFSPNQNNDGNLNDGVPFVMNIPQSEFEKIRKNIIQRESLNEEQALAFSIVCHQLEQIVFAPSPDKEPEPLRLSVLGEGGTGKSKVIHCIKEFFAQVDKTHWLRISATTGKAATLIGGTTVHSVIDFSIGGNKDKNEIKKSLVSESLKRSWVLPRFWIVDETSMVGCALLDRMNSAVSGAKLGRIDKNNHFGGVNVIFFGDFFQFQAVRDQPLYADDSKINSLSTAVHHMQVKNGHGIYRSFTKFVILKKQVRAAKDPFYQSFLSRLRTGNCTDDDIKFVKSKVGKRVGVPDIFHTRIIVGDNVTRSILNESMLKLYAQYFKKKIYFYDNEDTFLFKSNQRVSNSLRKEIHEAPATKCKGIDGRNFFVQGMPIMITSNIAPCLGVSNGTVGTLHQIIFDPKEDESKCERVGDFIKLNFQPECLLIKFDDDINFQHPDFERNVAPIVPQKITFDYEINVVGKTKKEKRYIKVSRKGFFMTLNFCCTAHKCQGETLSSAIIDLKLNLPKSNWTTTASYVPASRLQNSDGLYVLRDFDADMLRRCVNPALLRFMEEAELLNERTAQKYASLMT